MEEILTVGKSTIPKPATIINEPVPIIEFQHVSKEYPRRVAVAEVNIKINEGEFVSIVGQSGAGKTTLVKLLTKQESPTQGAIFVAGRNLRDLRNSEVPFYRRKIGVVFQDFKLLPQKTVWENVAFALEVCGFSDAEIQKRASRVLDLVNLSKRKNNYPNELSGGERQRTAIARALVHGPKILIADEPTGNLDPINTSEIIELLYRIHQRGTTVLLSTHNRQVVDKVQQRVILMKGGRVTSDEKGGKYVI